MNKKILYGILTVLAAIGITGAYAVNIDLKGDTSVDGNLDVTGNISGPTIDAIFSEISDASQCEPSNVQHWDKIIYEPKLLGGDITFVEPDGQPELLEGRLYDIKVIDDPTKNVDLTQTVADKLNFFGYKKQVVSPPPLRDINPDNIIIHDVEYGIVCVKIPL